MLRYLFTRKLSSKTEAFLINEVLGFGAVYSEFSNHYVSHRELEELRNKWGPVYKKLKSTWIPKSHRFYSTTQNLISVYPRLDKAIEESNAAFVIAEKVRYDELFSNIDGKSLDDQQRTAIVTGEDSNLVLAGAGSGKTLTISGKVKYLCDKKGVKPEDILLIAFTKKSAEEMQERISKKLGVNIDTFTFHKLGLNIISAARDERPGVSEDMAKFVTTYLTQTIKSKADEVKLIIQYFAYYLNIPVDYEQFGSLGEAYDHERGAELETLQSKYKQAQYLKDAAKERRSKYETLQKEKVKSLQEVEIANFLFLNGVKYEYERIYPFPTSDQSHRAYKPDFYLPEYDLYLEHFGINKDGELPWLDPIHAQEYKDGMKWKRETHAKNNTRLLETYSYYSSEGRLIPELERILRENGVAFKDMDFDDLFNMVYAEAGEKYFSEFIKLCCTFITLFKSRGLSVDNLDSLKYPHEEKMSLYYKERARLFLRVIKPIIIAYNEHLEAEGDIDFSDMINKATELVRKGYAVHPYKWVIIDEYQDISVSRFNLVKAIIDQTNAKILCVGDDWQSIYRFTGSDISLFTKFPNYFGKSEIMRIEKTYRNSQQLIDIAGDFIMKNSNQFKKSLRSSKQNEQPLVFMCYVEYAANIVRKAIDRVIREYGAEGSILLLGRSKYDAAVLEDARDFQYNKITGEIVYKSSPETKISFLTIHKSKGLEADNVILLNFKNDLLGFPNKIADDPLLSLVLNDSDEFLYAEERRLLYVAMTRTKNKTYVLVDDIIPSEFFREFTNNPGVEITHDAERYAGEMVECPYCKTGHLVVRRNPKSNRDFLGCSHYPQCAYTVNDTSILREKRKCPACGSGFLVKRQGYNEFYRCTNHPRCSHTETFLRNDVASNSIY